MPALLPASISACPIGIHLVEARDAPLNASNTTKYQQATHVEMAEPPPPASAAESGSILLPNDEHEQQPQPRPPSPHAVDHPGLLALISQGQFSHQTTLRTLRLHPDWLCSLPPAATTETPLHAVVRTGNLRLLEMLIAEHPSELDLQGVRDAQGRSVLEVARAGTEAHPQLAARVEDLVRYEEEAHALAAKLREGKTAEREDALVAALTRRLDWISKPHHKAWSVLHHIVHAGDVGLLERVVGIPGSWAGIKLRTRTRDCKRTVVELALAGGSDGGDGDGDSSPMLRFLRDVLGPMFGRHVGEEEQGGEGRLFPRVRAVAAGDVKIVHFIRHAEGTHNEAARLHGEGAYADWAWEDAELTDVGKQQCLRLHRRLLRARLMETIDLVVASPLRRTLATASLVFGEGGNGGEASSLVSGEGKEEASGGGGKGGEGAKRCLRPHVPPVVAFEAIREVAGLDPCNKRSLLSALQAQFPHVDFSEVRREEDAIFNPDRWESEEDMADRGHYFLWWLSQRPERTVAVVSHGTFLVTFFEKVLGVPQSMRHWWENTEVRSVAVHLPARASHTRPPLDLNGWESEGGESEEDDGV